MLERSDLTEGEQDFFNAVSFASNPIGFAANTIGSAVFDAAAEAGKNQGDASMLDYGGQGFNRGMSTNVAPAGTSGGGFFGDLGQTLGNVGRGIGGFFQDVAPLTSLLGINTPISRTNSGTATTIIRQAPDEQASSGEILGANLGMGANLIQAAGRFVRSPGGQSALGFGAGALGASLAPSGNGAPRVTRKMKSDVRRIYMMAGMDPNATAQILNNLGTYPRMNFNASLVFFILTKRFRNDGPVVTKAAVRKTKTTLRRMKGVVDMYNSVCKPTTRRAPARRAAPKAVQLIKN